MAGSHPDPRACMCLMAAVNLGMFTCSCALAFLGVFVEVEERMMVSKDLAITEGLAYVTRMLPPSDTQILNDYVSYAPAALVSMGFIGTCIAITGCHGAFSGGTCHLVLYSLFALVILAPQGYATLLLTQRGNGVADKASALVSKIWGSQCRCSGLSLDVACVPSSSECFESSRPADCKCRPCEDYLTATLCSKAAYGTSSACASHVHDLVATVSSVVLQLMSALIILEAISLAAALRIGVWSMSKSRAERSEERLLEQVYMNDEQHGR